MPPVRRAKKKAARAQGPTSKKASGAQGSINRSTSGTQESSSETTVTTNEYIDPLAKMTPRMPVGEKSPTRDCDGEPQLEINREIRFETGDEFGDDDVPDILAQGELFCQELVLITAPSFAYEGQARPMLITDDGIIRLAKACPNLKRFQLPSLSTGITDRGLIGLFEACPNLTWLELSGCDQAPDPRFSAEPLVKLRQNPQWLPGLKKLALPYRSMNDRYDEMFNENKAFIKAVKALTRARKHLTVKLVGRHGWGSDSYNENVSWFLSGQEKLLYLGPEF